MGKNKIELFEFDIDKVLKHGIEIEDLVKRKRYYEKVLEIKKNNKTIIDHSIGDRERDFVGEVKREIEEIDYYIENKIDPRINEPKKKNIIVDENKQDNTDEGINRELENAHRIIKRQTITIKTLKQGLSKNELFQIIEETRKKNGTINYSAIGRIIGCTNHTAKTRCKQYNLK